MQSNSLKFLWFTNGVQNIQVKDGQIIPDGYKRGRVVTWQIQQKSEEERLIIANKKIQTRIQRYGTYFTKEMEEKSQKTRLEKYGSSTYNNYNKMAETKLRKYGDKNFNNPTKTKQTCIDKYGGVGNQSRVLKEKQEKTMLEKYGVKHNWSSKNAKLNGSATKFDAFHGKTNYYKHVREKTRNTKNQKYGDENYRNKEKAEKTMLRKYGTPYFCTTTKCREKLLLSETKDKKLKTMLKNHTFGTSKLEEILYIDLCNIFGKTDIKRQYTDKRYPYHCDFYIHSQDVFIELNNHWTHGFHPFDQNDKDDDKVLREWGEKAKCSKYYQTAIYVWTQLDPAKKKCAMRNKLKYITLYDYKGGTISEFFRI